MKLFILKYFICLLFFSGVSQAFTQNEVLQGNFRIDGYELVAEKRISQNIFEYSYKITLTNTSGVELNNVEVIITNLRVTGLDDEVNVDFSIPGIKNINKTYNPNSFNIFQSVSPLLFLGKFNIGETKKSINTLTIRYDRSVAPLNINELLVFVKSTKKIHVNDGKNNQFSLTFLPALNGHIEITDLTIKTQQNPTNIPNINSLPFITENFIEITLPETFEKIVRVNIEVKYSTEPYRLLFFTENEIKWAVFEKDKNKGVAGFSLPVDENLKVTFALIGEY